MFGGIYVYVCARCCTLKSLEAFQATLYSRWSTSNLSIEVLLEANMSVVEANYPLWFDGEYHKMLLFYGETSANLKSHFLEIHVDMVNV